jgi:hypothetical protein
VEDEESRQLIASRSGAGEAGTSALGRLRRAYAACHLESMDDLGRDERPGLGTDPMYAILERERELSLEDEQRLGVSCMDVERRFSPTASGAHLDCAELLDVHEERDSELLVAEDDLAFADLDHVPAA